MKPDYKFTTDGCSGGMTTVWKWWYGKEPPWNDCCVEHDRLYWKGGTKEHRKIADARLLAKVAKRGHPVFAILMWLAVRPGGHPWLPFPWRWGYGYKYPYNYERKHDNKSRITK